MNLSRFRFNKILEALVSAAQPRTGGEVADAANVSEKYALAWLKDFYKAGMITRTASKLPRFYLETDSGGEAWKVAQ